MSMAADDPVIPPRAQRRLRPLPQLIFSSRWLQLPLYMGLIVAQAVYVLLFLKELWHSWCRGPCSSPSRRSCCSSSG